MDSAHTVQERYFEQGLKVRETLKVKGVSVINRHDSPLSPERYSKLHRYCVGEQLNWHTVIQGDTGDTHSFQVSRLLSAPPHKKPTICSQYTKHVCYLLKSTAMQSFFSGVLNNPRNKVVFRRGQFNRLPENAFIGPHIDRDADPDYEAVMVIHFNDNYQGGRLIYESQHDHQLNKQSLPESGSIVMASTDIVHQIETVTSGCRDTLVMFISNYAGRNRKPL